MIQNGGYWKENIMKKMTREQIIRARKNKQQQKKKQKNNRNFRVEANIQHNLLPGFSKRRNISQELHLLLAPDEEHKKVFPDVPVARCCNGKSLKDCLVITVLPETNGRSELCGKKSFQKRKSKNSPETFS